MYGDVEGILELAPAVGVIDNKSTPSASGVTSWLEEGSLLIDQVLSSRGYDVPVLQSAMLYPSLRSLAVLYATAYALRSRGMDVVEGKEESRSELYLKDFFNRLKALSEQDLTALGLTLRTSPTRATRRGVRSMQLRRVDGYSGTYETDTSTYDSPSE